MTSSEYEKACVKSVSNHKLIDFTTEDLRSWISVIEGYPFLSIKEQRYLSAMRRLLSIKECDHNWNSLRLVESGGRYQYCTLCGKRRVEK